MTPGKVVVVGAGVGGLAAAARLARYGLQVEVFEARREPGGLATGLEIEGFRFDAGPYILLDRPGLEWAFGQLGIDFGSGFGERHRCSCSSASASCLSANRIPLPGAVHNPRDMSRLLTGSMSQAPDRPP